MTLFHRDEIDKLAQDVAIAIRGGKQLDEGSWDGPTEEDQQLTAQTRLIAGYLYGLGWRRAPMDLGRIAASLEKLAWHVGAMESHSMKRLIMDAQARGIDVVTWDPTVAPWPHLEEMTHGNRVARLNKLYVGVPPEKRKNP